MYPAATMTFLSADCVVWSESWSLSAPDAPTALSRLRQLAGARVALLSNCVRIIQLKVTGQPTQQTNIRGTGGEGGSVRNALKLTDGGMQTHRKLRCVPEAIYNRSLTPKGLTAFNAFAAVVK